MYTYITLGKNWSSSSSGGEEAEAGRASYLCVLQSSQ
jgi:hypothetical protein